MYNLDILISAVDTELSLGVIFLYFLYFKPVRQFFSAWKWKRHYRGVPKQYAYYNRTPFLFYKELLLLLGWLAIISIASIYLWSGLFGGPAGSGGPGPNMHIAWAYRGLMISMLLNLLCAGHMNLTRLNRGY
jgi:hypothetical protein